MCIEIYFGVLLFEDRLNYSSFLSLLMIFLCYSKMFVFSFLFSFGGGNVCQEKEERKEKGIVKLQNKKMLKMRMIFNCFSIEKIYLWWTQPNGKINNGFIQLNSMEIEWGNNKKEEEMKRIKNKSFSCDFHGNIHHR